MQGHPANRLRQMRAQAEAGIDPAIGTWPGDPGFPTSSSAREEVERAEAERACEAIEAELDAIATAARWLLRPEAKLRRLVVELREANLRLRALDRRQAERAERERIERALLERAIREPAVRHEWKRSRRLAALRAEIGARGEGR